MVQEQLDLFIEYGPYNGVRTYPDSQIGQRTPLASMIYEFEWRTTPEGHDYWYDVYKKLRDMERNGLADWVPHSRERGRGDALCAAFVFGATPEGHEYWYDMANSLREIDLVLDSNGNV